MKNLLSNLTVILLINHILRVSLVVLAILISINLISDNSKKFALAETFNLNSPKESVIGNKFFITASKEDTLPVIARRYDLGFKQIVQANPNISVWLPGDGTKVKIPQMYVLPPGPRTGIILNRAEMRLYYFPKGDDSTDVMTFPVSLGREGWETPLGVKIITEKIVHPDWIPPPSLHREALAGGYTLPTIIKGGSPNNPLGQFALRLSNSTYLIHGTNLEKAMGIGLLVTHGCIRMYPEDIAQLFAVVTLGTKVTIIDEQIKVGERHNSVFVEIHPDLSQDDSNFPNITHQPVNQSHHFQREQPRDSTLSGSSQVQSSTLTFNKLVKTNKIYQLLQSRGFSPTSRKEIDRLISHANGIPESVSVTYTSSFESSD